MSQAPSNDILTASANEGKVDAVESIHRDPIVCTHLKYFAGHARST